MADKEQETVSYELDFYVRVVLEREHEDPNYMPDFIETNNMSTQIKDTLASVQLDEVGEWRVDEWDIDDA